MTANGQSVCAIVVTYNRKELLRQCLQALQAQTLPLDEILVVNNASVDGTSDMLVAEFPDVQHLELPENVGGAGGFAAGMKFAHEHGYHWFWLMDDDLLPASDALEKLVSALTVAENSAKIFVGGLAQNKSGKLAWSLKANNQWFNDLSDFAEHSASGAGIAVEYLPFLGVLIPARAVSDIGLPRVDYFIYLDDVEYCYRARKNGYTILCVPQSKLFHPILPRDSVNLLGKEFFIERIPVWKSYYEIRNRILLGLEYEGMRFWIHLWPVVVLRIILSFLRYREERFAKLQFHILGLWDGFRGYTDRRIIS